MNNYWCSVEILLRNHNHGRTKREEKHLQQSWNLSTLLAEIVHDLFEPRPTMKTFNSYQNQSGNSTMFLEERRCRLGLQSFNSPGTVTMR